MLPNTEQLKPIWQQSFATLALTLLILFFLYKWLHPNSSPNKTLTPSPPWLPILGNLHQLGTHPHRALKSLSEKYGDLMLIHLGRSPAIVVSSAKSAQEIMKTNDIVFSNRPTSKTGNKPLYNGKDVAIAPYGEYWRQMKSICVLQLLSNKRVQSFRGVREEELSILMKNIDNTADSVVNLSEKFRTFTNNVICRVAFGRTYDGNEVGIDFKKLLNEFLVLLGTVRVGDFVPWLGWINWVDGSDAKVDNVAREFDLFLEQVVAEHQDRRGDSRNDGVEVVKDIVDVLIDVQKDNPSGFTMDRDSIKALILMKYLKAVIKETLRLHPPIPLLVPRQSTHDTMINGYDIPSGTMVINNAWAIHRDPASWDEPEKFNPERFLNRPTHFRGQDFELIPFGAGRMICPGITFATANNELVLANLVHKFGWKLPGGADGGETLDMGERIGITAHRNIPLLAVATPVIADN